MSTRHYTDEELLAYLDCSEEIDLEAVSRHLSACDACGTSLESLRYFTQLLSDSDVYAFAARRPRRRVREHDIQDAVRRIVAGEQVRLDAQRTFQLLMALTIDEWPAYLKAYAEVQSEALFGCVIEEARREFDRRPDHALKLLDIAATIANSFTNVFAIAEHRGTVAKERSNALRMLGRYPEALESLDWAERFYAHLPAPDYDLAFVAWARATVYFYMTRYAEALILARAVAATFRAFGDIGRVEQVRILEANILCEQGQVADARRMYAALKDYFVSHGDHELVARLHANLAECEVRLNRPQAARESAAQAIAVYKDLGRPVEVIRVRWSLGHLLMRQRHDAEAFEELRAAAADFRGFNMTAAAGGVDLDLVELHLQREEWNEAEQLARKLVDLFTAAQAPLHQTEATAYLRESVQRRTVTTDLLDSLRTYLAADSTEAVFEPPQPEA